MRDSTGEGTGCCGSGLAIEEQIGGDIWMAGLCLTATAILGGSREDDEQERLGAELATCIGQEDDPVGRGTTAVEH